MLRFALAKIDPNNNLKVLIVYYSSHNKAFFLRIFPYSKSNFSNGDGSDKTKKILKKLWLIKIICTEWLRILTYGQFDRRDSEEPKFLSLNISAVSICLSRNNGMLKAYSAYPDATNFQAKYIIYRIGDDTFQELPEVLPVIKSVKYVKSDDTSGKSLQ